jgi:hypothetical protein
VSVISLNIFGNVFVHVFGRTLTFISLLGSSMLGIFTSKTGVLTDGKDPSILGFGRET